MLRGAGLDFTAHAADLDEASIIQNMQQVHASIPDIAAALARQKALAVAAQHPDALVIGSDQILEFHGEILSKALSTDEAAEKLKRLRGHDHHLISAVSIAMNDQILWDTHDQATLHMHDFDDTFLQQYLSRAGEALTSAVGGYWLEDVGAWLFREVKGDYFTILGMPLLPLLSYLKEAHCD